MAVPLDYSGVEYKYDVVSRVGAAAFVVLAGGRRDMKMRIRPMWWTLSLTAWFVPMLLLAQDTVESKRVRIGIAPFDGQLRRVGYVPSSVHVTGREAGDSVTQRT